MVPSLILSVDDFAPQRYARSAILRAAGYTVIEAATGQRALELVREHRPALVLLDVQLPDIDGFEVCRQIKADPGTAGTLVLHLSATFIDSEVRRGALENGADAYLCEPVDRDDLLAQVRVLMRLAESERRLRETAHEAKRQLSELEAIYRHSPVGLCVFDRDLRWVRLNERIAEINGVPLEAHLGRTPHEIVPDVGEQAEEALRHILETGEPLLDFEMTGTTAAQPGVQRAWNERWVPIRDEQGAVVGIAVAAEEITERKRAEQALRASESALRASEERLALAREAADVAIHDFDVATGTIRWDERLRGWWGLGPDEPVTVDTFIGGIHPDDRADARRAMEGAFDPAGHGKSRTEFRVRARNGVERWLAVTGQVFFQDGRPVRLVGTAQDVTERRKAEEALREADRRKDEFIAILSHELRNPLAPIRYALPLIARSESGNPVTARALAVIERQVDHLTRLVDDLLEVSRITSGNIELRREFVTLDAVVGAAIESASPAVGGGHHTLQVDIASEPIWVYADPTRLSQVVTNLVDNSAKYTPRGGRIQLTAGRERDEAVIRVRDNGMGIAPGELPAVFDMFRRVSRPEGSPPGLGIGLALARRLIAKHHGTITVHSDGPGTGTEVMIRLPVAKDAKAGRSEEAVPALAASGRLKVLVVDDNADLVEMLAMVVQAAGHEVRKAHDGASALAAAAGYRPHVVLLDLGLPGMSGLEVAREMRRRPETAAARIVALTGLGQAEDRRQTSEAGFDCHLTKPAAPEVLDRLLAQFASDVR